MPFCNDRGCEGCNPPAPKDAPYGTWEEGTKYWLCDCDSSQCHPDTKSCSGCTFLRPIRPGAKLYVVVRADLSPGLQASQAFHAGQEWVFENRRLAKEWKKASNIVVILTLPNESALIELREAAARAGVDSTSFDDTDLSPTLTALVLEPVPEAARLCVGLNLALRKAAA